jgi:hypothetical protein
MKRHFATGGQSSQAKCLHVFVTEHLHFIYLFIFPLCFNNHFSYLPLPMQNSKFASANIYF